MRLEKKLNSWEEQSIISTEQKKQILEFEKANQKPFFAMGMTLLGFFVIALGVISIIAANWDYIPAVCKIIMDMLLLSFVALWTFRVWQKGRDILWVEGGIVGLFMLCGASIGLIGQVFQINGSFAQFGIFWCFISLPLLFISCRKVLPFLWIALLLGSMIDTEFFRNCLEIVFGWVFFERFPECGLLVLLLIGGAMVGLFSLINHIFKPKFQIFNVMIFYSYLLIYSAAAVFMIVACSGNARFFINTYIILIVLFVGMAFIGDYLRRPRLVNGNIAALYIVFLMIYFRVFGSLMVTGIGLIISGGVIIGGLKLTRNIMKTIKNMREKEGSNAKI